ncbi:MAG TPA: DMT family transporter [Chloroflexia bacterium]|nr:DMT family transporter [Chloroflexia bacterium]
MFGSGSSHRAALLQALFVTFLWSTSWVLIKIGLHDVPALTFAGLRYMLAVICLLPFVLRPTHVAALRSMTAGEYRHLLLLGVFYIAITQGAQFVGLALLPAVTVSLLLNFTPVLVAVMGIFVLREIPTRSQWAGVMLYLVGVAIYFYPVVLPADQVLGLAVMVVGVLSNTASALLGRKINREANLHPLLVTAFSMGVGAVILLFTGVVAQGLPALSLSSWLIIAWLAAVNTAFALTIWNQTMRTLSAVESSTINGTMLVQIALLAWIFLGEGVTWKGMVGMALVALAAVLSQRRPNSRTGREGQA